MDHAERACTKAMPESEVPSKIRMSEPTVCAVMLTRDRPAMARRAVECFRAQTYDPIKRVLIIYDSGDNAWFDPRSDSENEMHIHCPMHAGKSIGELRNLANRYAFGEVILHLDSDDWSHPNRIAEQVALLQASGAECVGYREMLFWREPPQTCPVCRGRNGKHTSLCAEVENQGEAWLYTDAYRPVGTSLCYWRSVWERQPFSDLPNPHRKPNPDVRGEDVEWLRGVKAHAVSIMGPCKCHEPAREHEPRMIARIHGGNSSGSYAVVGKSDHWWKRVPAWDSYCRERMG